MGAVVRGECGVCVEKGGNTHKTLGSVPREGYMINLKASPTDRENGTTQVQVT